MTTTAFVFPGQGSQFVGMADAWLNASGQADSLFQRACDVLQCDLKALVQSGPEEVLGQTQWTQPALLVTAVAAWQGWQAAGGSMPDYLAGHSLGEYTALVCAGALDFDDAVALVHKRGQYMQSAVPEGQGAMAAILGLEDQVIESVCEQVNADMGKDGAVSAANFNAPGQVVISGHADAVRKATEKARQAGAKRVIPLAVSVPSHCSLMRLAAEKLAYDLQSVSLKAPKIPVVHNVTAKTCESEEEIRALLVRQLFSPVRWTQTMQYLKDAGVESVIECGPGKVLSGLFKRFDRRWPTASIQSPDDISKLDLNKRRNTA